jgi:hypothetical protein
MKQKLFFSFLVVSFTLLFIGCGGEDKPKEDDNRISEGVITYTAELVDPNHPMADMAPTKMTVKFKNNKSAVEMAAGMGFLSMSFVSDPEAKTLTNIVRIISQKYSSIQNETDIKKENELFNIEVVPGTETKVIAGYKCKMARVHYKGGEPSDFDIYYTSDINMKNSNFANPYFMIDGVLMEYRVKKFGLEMQFVATSVVKEPIDDAVFECPPDYKPVSYDELALMLRELQ